MADFHGSGVILIALLIGLVLSSICPLYEETRKKLGFSRRRLAESGEGDSSTFQSSAKPDLCEKIQESATELEGTASLSFLPSVLQRPLGIREKRRAEYELAASDIGQKSKRHQVERASSGEGSLSDIPDVHFRLDTLDVFTSSAGKGVEEEAVDVGPHSDSPSFLESQLVESMLLAESESFDNWLLDPEEEIPPELFEPPASAASLDVGLEAAGQGGDEGVQTEMHRDHIYAYPQEGGERSDRVAFSSSLKSVTNNYAGPPSSQISRLTSDSSGISDPLSADGSRVSLGSPLTQISGLGASRRKPSPSSVAFPSTTHFEVGSIFNAAHGHAKAHAGSVFTAGCLATGTLSHVLHASKENSWDALAAAASTTFGPEKPRARPSSLAKSVDPFYHVPTKDPTYVLKPFNYATETWTPHFVSVWHGVMSARKCLAKHHLNGGEMELLRISATYLVTLGKNGMPEVPAEPTPSMLVQALAHRYLTMDATWAACEALGSAMNKELWWVDFAQRVVGTSRDAVVGFAKRVPTSSQLSLIQELRDALSKFLQGVRPSLKEARALKQALFCQPDSPAAFKKPSWDPFREDLGGSSAST
ncbi:hypothetical protein Emed_006941 [Eimeria media]